MKMQKIKLLSALTMAFALPSAPALAGPTWEFGPDYQGLLKFEYKGQFRLTVRDTGSGPDNDETSKEFNFRRNRLAFMGVYGDHLGMYVQADYIDDTNIGTFSVGDGGSDFRLLDAVFRFNYNDSLNFWAGKFKHSGTRENMEACYKPLTLDRSLFIRTPLNDDGTRDKGVELWGNLFDQRFQYRVAAMNGRNDSGSSPDTDFRYTARGHVTLLDPESSHGYRGTYRGEKKVLTLGASYQMENDVAFNDVTANTGAVDYEGWSADLFFEYPLEDIGTFTFSTAYADYDLEDAYQGANPDSETIGVSGEKNGGYTKIGYMLPNMPLQFFARAENWSFAQLRNVIDQEVDWYAGGLNYYFRGQNLKLTLEYSSTDFDKEGTYGGVTSEDFETLVTQLQLIF